MKNYNDKNEVDVLNELIMASPIALCIATASSTHPDATVKEILSEISTSADPDAVALDKYGLLQLFYKDRPVPFTEEDLSEEYYGHLEALCPFHLDAERGSFKITPSKNLWWCFSCTSGGSGHSFGEGRGGTQINYEMDFYNLEFVDAVYHLAYRLGFINEYDYNRRTNISINREAVSSLNLGKSKRHLKEDIKADPEIIHNVYTAMQLVSPLSKEDRNHLIYERGLNEADLINYFTYPDRSVDLPAKIIDCIRENYSLARFNKHQTQLNYDERNILDNSQVILEIIKQLRYVPGFYFNKTKNKHEFVSYTGIGLLCRDENGKVKGIQVRARNRASEGKGFRYLWLSSSFASSVDEYDGGSSPGSPGGVIFPKNKPVEEAALCVTEGRFKGEQIAKDGNLTVYLSGVSTWRNITNSISSIKGNRDKIYLMYDADALGNTAVFAQLNSMCEWSIGEGLEPYLIVWRKEYGKGYDDLKLANPYIYKQLLKVISFESFKETYWQLYHMLLRTYNVEKINDIDRELADQFTEDLQNLVEKQLRLPFKKGGNI